MIPGDVEAHESLTLGQVCTAREKECPDGAANSVGTAQVGQEGNDDTSGRSRMEHPTTGCSSLAPRRDLLETLSTAAERFHDVASDDTQEAENNSEGGAGAHPLCCKQRWTKVAPKNTIDMLSPIYKP